ncbi:MAG: aminopeptidase N [Candidatus Dormibacteria bacterium]
MPEPSRPLSRAEAQERAGQVGTCSYRLELDFTRGREVFGFRVELEFEGRRPGGETFLDTAVSHLQGLEWNGARLPLSDVRGERLALSQLLPRNRLVAFGESRFERDGLGMHLAVDHADESTYIYSEYQPVEARLSFPCFDQPDLKGTYALRVRAPQEWVVVFVDEGEPEEAQDGSRWWNFPTTMPLSVYTLGIAAGPFHRVQAKAGRIPLSLYCPRSLARFLDPDEIFELTQQGLDYYGRAFGIPYPFSKYDQVFVPEKVSGAMESPGCVTITDSLIWRGRPTPRWRSYRAEVILHEMAHMWFGDLVTMRWWDDIWLNESFATLMAAMSQDRATRIRDSWLLFVTSYTQHARRQDQWPTSHPVVTPVDDVEAVRSVFDGITYEKGAAVLRQLVAWVGEEPFFSGLHAHLETHREGNATFADLVQALELSSGRDVSTWSKSWLETVGVNTLRLELDPSPVGTRMVKPALLQSAPAAQPTIRPHHLRVGLYDWVGEELRRVDQLELDISSERTELPALEGRARPPLLLANDESLTYAKLRLDAVSLETASRHLTAIPDALTRALLWDSAWDSAYDAELPAHRYSEMVISQAPGEPELSLLASVLANFKEAVRHLGTPRRAESLEQRLAEVAWAQMEVSPPGSDRQAVWLRAFVTAATTAAQVARVRALLDGGELPKGVSLDTELTWLLVQELGARGAAGEADLQGALAQDPSPTGQARLEAARAAMPTEEAKERAWASLTDPASTIEASRMVAAMFGGVRQEELVAPFFPRLPQTLADVWARRGAELTLELGRFLQRSLHPDPGLRQACQEAIADQRLHPEVRRIFEGQLAETERGLRARALDEPDSA